MNLYSEIANSIFETFLAKLKLLKLSADHDLKSIADNLLEYITKEKNELENELDDILACKANLAEFKNHVEPMIDLLGLLIASTKASSIWVIPLLEKTYEKLSIHLSDRKILAIHSLSRINDNRNTFRVHIDVLRILPMEVYIHIDNPLKIDIFEIPSETQFNLSSLAILGHEVGHVFWYTKVSPSAIKTIFSEQLKDKYDMNDLFGRRQSQEAIINAMSHTEELFCDCIGRTLFGIIFDIALLKALCFSSNGRESSRTHPPSNLRAQLSYESLDIKLTDIKKNEALKNELELLIVDFSCRNQDYTIHNEKAVVDTLQNLKSKYPVIENSINIDSIWEKISKELDAFRPPIESVSREKPNLFSPVDILIGTVLYVYSKNHYMKNNSFFKDSENKPPEENEKILLKTLKEHVIYAIGNYKFLKKAYSMYIDTEKFEQDKLSHTLWTYREKLTLGTKKEEFSVVPSIYPNVQYGQSSVDIRLGSYFLIHKPSKYVHISPYPEDDIGVENFYEEVYVPPGGEFILHPHQFVLASTLEYISLPINYYGLILGRSSWGRLGLTIATATTVQAGFKGCITLELKNVGETPLPLKVGNRISQLCLIKSPEVGNTDKGYYDNIHAKYIGPIKAEIPKIKQDIDWELLNNL
jgi:dCTP deaminase